MNKMEHMEIKKLVISMSLPIIISMVIQALYNIVDSIFVAKISSDALTAVSLCYPVQTIIVAIACGTAVGFNTLLARYLGEKKFDYANNTMMHGILLGFLNGLVFLVLGFLFSNTFLSWFTRDVQILGLANTYIRICTMFSFSVFVQIIFERIMQATGNAIYNMVMQGAGAIINIILDPIMIFGWFGLPRMGVTGAAIATVIGQFCGMMIGYWITKKKIDTLEIKGSNFRFSTDILARIYKVGVPAILMQSVLSFMTVFMNMILAPISAMAISAFSVYYKLQNFLNMAVLGITNALIPIVAYNNGAKRKDRARDAIQFSLLLSIGIMFVGTIIFQLFPKQLLSMFSANDEMYAFGIPALKIISLSFVFAGISMVLCAAFQALNKANTSLVITLARQLVILIPLTYGLMKCFGINVGWYAFVVTEILCSMYSLFEWRKMKR
ncbi:MATE family efflux transporter [Holdemanella biformis]